MSGFLQILGLRLALGNFTLGELSLELERGDYFILMGPNGCGKSTLLKTIAGMFRDHAGDIIIDGERVNPLPPQKRGVGCVSQTGALFPHLNVRRNIAFGMAYSGLPRTEQQRRVDRMVELMGVGELMSRWPATLSGGERRRVALAQSLVVGPRVLLLDEPLSMLDTNARRTLLEALRLIHDQIKTVTIHVTHHCEEAWALQGRCGVMQAGRIVQTGLVDELFRRPRSRFVAEFLGGRNIFPARFENGEHGPVANLDWAIFPLAGAPAGASGFVQIRPEGLRIAGHTHTPTLPHSHTPSLCRGIVRRAADRGIYVELTVKVEPGPELVVHLISPGTVPAPGDSIVLECAAPLHPIEEADNEPC